ncbi:hypothetical protein F4778DRAFT_785073 [Xylariomycetidae sp. FL2044]|nr:hypothetical protein F4778DRAFT_785073 [Xylariomycetidae sp. FL2044]
MSQPSFPSEEPQGSEGEQREDDDDGSASDDNTPSPSANLQTTSGRLRDNSIFEQWKKDGKYSISASAAQSSGKDDIRSVSWLVRDAEKERIIASPREYQLELFERAKKENVIAVLDTGTGKTLIAALLLRHTIERELEDRDAGKPPRVSFFLVDKVSLVIQQYQVLKANLDHPIQHFYGSNRNLVFSHSF